MKKTLAVLFGVLASLPALGQQCGPNPEANVSWSSSLRKAVIHQECKASSGSGSVSIDELSLGGSEKSANCSSDSMTDEQAQSFIQTEIKNQTAAIVSTCGYYACMIPGDTTRLSFLSDVCAPALGTGDVGSPVNDFRVVPRFLPLVVSTPSRDIKLYVKNNLDGTITIAKPVPPDAHLRIIAPAGQFTIPARGEKVVTVRVFTPAHGDSPMNASVGLHLATNAGVENRVDFAIARTSTDLLPPPSIGCGTMNPGMVATAFSDRAPGQGFDPKPCPKAMPPVSPLTALSTITMGVERSYRS